MDFARRQLEKYGWIDGKGLGKHENGISQALKPKLKRSVTGIGHDAAADFTEHWWKTLYDKAASNVEVQESKGRTKKIKTKDQNNFEITNSTWKLNKRHKTKDTEEQYVDYFVKTAVLTNGGSKTEKVIKDSDSEEVEEEKRDVFKMTDAELFAACEGRTAHKGARHGLKALGKLARIEQQEQMLLQQMKYQGYSHSKKILNKEDQVNDTSLISQSDTLPMIKKKKKRKHSTSKENLINLEEEHKAEPEILLTKKSKKKCSKDVTETNECDISKLQSTIKPKETESNELDLNKSTKRKDKNKKRKRNK